MAHHESAARGQDGRMVDRMLFFSDAVFAIMLTLLALEIRAPGLDVTDEQALLGSIASQGEVFASYAISFALGSAFWLAHMRTTRMLHVWDWSTAIVNLFHLLTVGLLPFAAGLLGEHIQSSVAYSGYSVIIVLVSFTGGFLWLAATRGGGKFVGGMGWRQRVAGFIRTTSIGWAFVAGLVISFYFGMHSYTRFSWLLLFPLLALARVIAGKPEVKS